MSKSTINLTTQKPIFAAIQSGNIEAIKQLLSSNNIDLTVQTTTPLEIEGRVTMQNTHLTPFSALCVLYKYCPDKSKGILDAFNQMSNIFSKSDRYTNPVNSQGCTEFMWAVWTGNLDLIKKSYEFIKHCDNNYDFNRQDKGGRTALHVAVQNNVEKEIIEYLIKNVGVKVDLQDCQGMTALFQAALAQGGASKLDPKLNLVDELLENGANPNIPCSGKLLLSTLCEYIWKLKQGCLNPNNSSSKKVEYVTDITKYTPIVKDLVAKIIQSNKFDPTAKDAGTGFSAVHWVGELGAEKASTLLQKLQELKVDINNGDASGHPTLNWYSDYNIHPIVTKLLELGANVNTQANNGETAPHDLLLNISKTNSGKAKLPTLKLLLSHNNEPPYKPTLIMQGKGTTQDVLNSMINSDDDTDILPDLMDCHTLFEDYNKWYDETIALPILGAALDNFDLYA